MDYSKLALDHQARCRDTPGVFPDPVVVAPIQEHRQTFIILHGRGSTAEKFCVPLLETVNSKSKQTLQRAFPHAKLIFLTASKSRAVIYKRHLTHQWFDNWHMDDPKTNQHLPIDGLKKSIAYVQGFLQKEIEEVGPANVVLWGLSQGCATSLSTLLTWDGEPFAAVVGMCGYLPFSNLIREVAGSRKLKDGTYSKIEEEDENESESGSNESSDEDSDEQEEDNGIYEENIDNDPFLHSGDDGADDEDPFYPFSDPNTLKEPSTTDLPTQAINYFRGNIDVAETTEPISQQIPVFLGHGTADDAVSIDFGREAKACLQMVKVDVKMVEYQDLGHWYSEDMLGDIFEFLSEKLEAREAPEGNS